MAQNPGSFPVKISPWILPLVWNWIITSRYLSEPALVIFNEQSMKQVRQKDPWNLHQMLVLGLALGRINIDYALSNIGSVSGVQASHIFSASMYFTGR